jgi:NDP-sugar pyrophosphorylase family protein
MVSGARGVIMAGGKSERMRATNGPVHKALVEVGGTPLIERNLLDLVRAGILDVTIVTSHDEPAIRHYVETRGALLAQQFAATLTSLVEPLPLGNIGVVGELNDGRTDLIVIYVDNLTSIAPHRLLERHRETRAAFTIASHLYALTNPFGELDIVDGHVRTYLEKPTRNVRISSGTCVVGPAAAALAPKGRPLSAVGLFNAVAAKGLRIAAYEHDELWIDINDAQALREANALVQTQPGRLVP